MLLLGILFALALGGGLALGHWYAWRRLVQDTELGPLWRRGLALFFILVTCALPISVFVARQTASRWASTLVFLGFSWMGFLFYLLMLLLVREVLVFLLRLWKKRRSRIQTGGVENARSAQSSPPSDDQDRLENEESSNGRPPDPGRRLFLTRVGAGAVLGGATLAGVTGMRSALGDIETPEQEIRLARLPRSLSGYRIVVLSDLHLGPTLGERFVSRVIELAKRQRPDLVVITGDLVDGSVRRLGSVVRPLAGIDARDGIFFVTGNHEYYSGVDSWVRFLNRVGIRVLANQHVPIQGQGKNGFDLAGVNDYRAAVFRPGHGPDPVAAVSGRDPDRELVLLAHQPVQIHKNAAVSPGLQISGHTHGGQIWPWGYMVRLTQPYLSGLHRYDERTQVFVTRGTGYWGPPIRFLAPAEIPCLVLVS